MFPKIWEPSENYKGDRKQGSYTGASSMWRPHTNLFALGTLCPGLLHSCWCQHFVFYMNMKFQKVANVSAAVAHLSLEFVLHPP